MFQISRVNAKKRKKNDFKLIIMPFHGIMYHNALWMQNIITTHQSSRRIFFQRYLKFILTQCELSWGTRARERRRSDFKLITTISWDHVLYFLGMQNLITCHDLFANRMSFPSSCVCVLDCTYFFKIWTKKKDFNELFNILNIFR